MKRIISMVLALTMLLSCATVSLSADETVGTAAGEAVAAPAEDVAEPIPAVTEPTEAEPTPAIPAVTDSAETEPAAEVTEPALPGQTQPSLGDEYAPLPDEVQTDLLPADNMGGEWGIFRPDAGIRLPGNDELFEQYLTKLLYGGEAMPLASGWGREQLSEAAKKVYDDLKPHFIAIANGTETSSIIQLQPGTVVTVEIMSEFFTAMTTDFPSEIYWLDPYTTGWAWMIDSDTGIYTVVLDVAAGYRTSKSADYYGRVLHTEVDLTKIERAKAALQNARDICASATGTETEKAKFFASEINRLANYDYDAYEEHLNNNITDLSPWMLINVFDGYTSTNVVCEGFAKSFRYLCELADIECYCVTGDMNGGRHMWNVVRLDGEMHVLDVTGVDGGYSFEHYMNNVTLNDKGYVIGDSTYVYDNSMFDLYPESILMVSKSEEVTTVASGICGENGADNLTWTLDSAGTLTVSGTGRMYDFPSDNSGSFAWFDANKVNRNSIKNIIIEDGVTSIGANAFNNFDALISVTMPDTLTSIGDGAFTYCVLANSFKIPGSVTSIGDLAFYGCQSLTSIVIPASVTTMGQQVFEVCTSLTAINCEAASKPAGWSQHWTDWNDKLNSIVNWNYTGSSPSVETIDSGTCGKYGTNLTWTLDANYTLTISGTGDMADYTSQYAWPTPTNAPWFQYTKQIVNVVIEEGVTSIGSYAFNGCKSLTSISLPNTVASIKPDSIIECKALASIDIYSDNPYYSVVNNCLIENSTSSILSAYGNCSIPDIGIACIQTYAFSSLSTAVDIVIPASVTDIKPMAFTFGYILSITVDEGNARYYVANKCLIDRDTKTLLKGYADSVIPDDGSVTVIGNAAFRYERMETITIPNTIVYICGDAFFSCPELTSIIIPASVVKMDAAVFAYSNKLATIYCKARTQPEGWSTAWICWNNEISPKVEWNYDNSSSEQGEILYSGTCGENDYNLTWSLDSNGLLTISGSGRMDEYTRQWDSPKYTAPWFEYRELIVDVVIEDGVTSIGSYAFNECNKLLSVTIPASVQSIRRDSFVSSSSIIDIIMPDGNSYYTVSGNCLIEKNTKTLLTAINGCSIPNDGSVEVIEKFAFSTVSDNTDVVIPASVTGIEQNALCYGAVQSVTVEEGNTNYYMEGNCLIEASTKMLLKGFADSIIPGDVKTLGFAAFRNTRLESITVPNSVTTISEEAFAHCYWLKTATIPGSVIVMGPAVFSYSGSLETITCGVASQPDGWDAKWICWNGEITPTVNWEEPGDADIIASGVCGAEGGNLTWTLNGAGMLTISGNGEMDEFTREWDYPRNSAPWFVFRDSIVNVIIEEGVTSIGNNAFDGVKSLVSVSIPSTVEKIGLESFICCEYITDMTVAEGNSFYKMSGNCLIEIKTKTLLAVINGCSIPNDGSVEIIAKYAFSSFIEPADIVIPSSVTMIEPNALSYYPVRSVTVEEGNTNYYVEGNCLIERSSKTIIKGFRGSVIPEDVVAIGAYAFANGDVDSLTIPSNITSIGGSAFTKCQSLEFITIPGSVVTMGAAVFGYSGNLKTITCCFNEQPAGWHSNWLCWNNEINPVINWDENGSSSVVANGYCGENDGTNLTWNLNSEGVLTISGTGKMDNYNREWDSPQHLAPWTDVKSLITRVVVEEGVTSIGTSAFPYCASIKSAEISSTVTSIAATAFNGCSSLASIIVSENNSEYYMRDNCLISRTDKALVTALNGFVIPDDGSVTRLNNYAFSSSYGPFNVVIPACVTVIEEHTLSNWNVASISVQPGSTSYRMENNCLIGIKEKMVIRGFGNGIIPTDPNVNIIGADAFSHTNLASIVIPDNITEIHTVAFSYCTSLKSVVIPASVTTIEDAIFSNSTNIESIRCEAAEKPEGWNSSWLTWGSSPSIDIVEWGYVADEDIIASGTCGAEGGNLTWKLDGNGVLTISGTGEIDKTINYINAPWAQYGNSGQIKKVVINEGVTSAYLGTFDYGVGELIIPSTVSKLGRGNFISYKGLVTRVTISPDNKLYCVKDNCVIDITNKSLIRAYKGYKIPGDGSVTKILQYSISDDSNTEIVIPEGVKEIEADAITSTHSLTKVSLPGSLEKIGTPNFTFGPSLDEITIAENPNYHVEGNCLIETATKKLILGTNSASIPTDGSVTTIVRGAFQGRKITALSIPSSITKIEPLALYGIDGLTSISVDPANKNYSMVSGCLIENDTKTLIIAFDGCTIPTDGSVEIIAENAFTGCKQLESIRIPNTVTTIKSCAFNGCHNLKSLEISGSVTSIESAAFGNCTKLANIYCEAESMPGGWDPLWLGWDGNVKPVIEWGCNFDTGIIANGYCGAENDGSNLKWELRSDGTLLITGTGRMADYSGIYVPLSAPLALASTREATTAAPWSEHADKITRIIIESGVTSIGANAFNGCASVAKVSISKDIEEVGASAFDNCESLTDIYCEAEDQPAGWDEKWQGGNKAEVHWNDKGDVGGDEPANICGDVDGNGIVNMLDGIAIMKYFNKWDGFVTGEKYDFTPTVADVDGNGTVNMLDGIAVMKHFNKWSGYETLPIKK